VSDFSDVLAASTRRDGVRIDQASGLHHLVTERSLGNVSQILEAMAEPDPSGSADEYDFIVVDSPPVMRVPDLFSLASG